MRPPATLTDGVVVLRELREDDRAVVLATMGDELVHRWLNMPAGLASRTSTRSSAPCASGRASRERIDYTVTEAGRDIALGAVIASRRPRDNYEIAYLAGATGRGRGLMTRGGSAPLRLAVQARGRAARAADASGERAVAARSPSEPGSSAKARAQVDLAARAAAGRDRVVAAPDDPR